MSKSYGPTRVLHEVSLDARRNRIIGIVGENGAGKSTLFNILSGLASADAGSVTLRGREIRPANYHEASLLGISRVFQEQALIPGIAIYENILLSHEGRFTRFGQWLDKTRLIKTAQGIVDEIGLDVDVRRRTDTCSFSVRQSIEIARACLLPRLVLGIADPVILLDEPTSALAKAEEEALFTLLQRIRAYGTVLFVSHRLTEVLAVSDEILVLKDGRLVAGVEPRATSEAELHGLMVGRARDEDYYDEAAQRDVSGAEIALSVRGLTRAGAYEDVSLDLRRGEVLGIGGLVDSGKSAFGKGLAGIDRPDAGQVTLAGGAAAVPRIEQLVRDGLGYLPAERLVESIISGFPVAWNISLASGADLFSDRNGVWKPAAERRVAERYLRELEIKAPSPDTPCATLSGGNQQKVALAKWLCRDPKVLVLDNPTRGLDAGAREEIYRLIRRLTAAGTAILLISDELLELIGLSNRIIVLQRGRAVAEIPAPAHAKPAERALVQLMLGSDAPIFQQAS